MRVAARDLREGDVIHLPGSLLHEDLSGLWYSCTLNADPVQLFGRVLVPHSGHSVTGFYPDETLTVWRPSELV